jgi:hypothetical protein
MKKQLYDFDHTTGDGQKRLMAISKGLPQESYTIPLNTLPPISDYGADPLGDGKFKMVPSGDIVDYDEMKRRRKIDKIYLVDESGNTVQ